MENLRPKYSIIIPLYNKESYVRKTIESVLSQTFRDFELIIVDDGSSDNSATICEEFIKEASQTIHNTLYIIHQTNSGVAAARNNGVKASKGDYVSFLDADDWWKPTFLEEMDKLIVEYPDAGIYATNYIYYKLGKTRVALHLPRGYINYPEAYLHCVAMPVTSITTCMPRHVFDEMGGFPIGIKLGEDFILWAKTALHYSIAFCEKPLAYYNNNVPASLRATRNLHAPEHHMLFHLDPLEEEIKTSNIKHNTSHIIHNTSSWHQLLDHLRVTGLMPYWMSDEYHDVAANELAKVDWSKQPKSIVDQYKTPIWLLRLRKIVMRLGSYIKQRVIAFYKSCIDSCET